MSIKSVPPLSWYVNGRGV